MSTVKLNTVKLHTVKLNTVKKFTMLIATGVAVSLSACQSIATSPVLKRADHVFETTSTGKTKTLAQKQALYTAQKQCGLKTAVILSDNITYNGVLDEKTGRLIDQGVAIVGGVLGTKAPSLARDDDYEYHIRFRCQ